MAAISPEQAGGLPLVHFLDLCAFSEGTSTHSLTRDDGYDVIVTGVSGPNIFEDYSFHPFAKGRKPIVVREAPNFLESTASGRYQLLLRYWAAYRAVLHYTDFSPVTQDLIALRQIDEKKATALILAGNIESAIAACSGIWASLPGNAYGQGGKSMTVLLAKYQELSQ